MLASGELVPALGVGRTPLVQASTAYHLLPADPASPGASSFASWLRAAGSRAAAEGLALVAPESGSAFA
jgi:hypothetical protein